MIQSRAVVFVIPFFLLAIDVHAQLSISGIVVDSANSLPLSNVSILVKNNSRGTWTNAEGYFTVNCSKNDSIIITAVGYRTQVVSAERLLGNRFIFLTQSQTLLKEIIVYPSIGLMGLPPIPKESPWRNPTYTKEYMNTPGAPVIQTFGPSVIIKGALGKFGKEDRERKKLKKLKEENNHAEQYVSILSDSSLQRNLQEMYNLKSVDFPKLIAEFNRQFPDAYRMQKDEIITSFTLFLSQWKEHD